MSEFYEFIGYTVFWSVVVVGGFLTFWFALGGLGDWLENRRAQNTERQPE